MNMNAREREKNAIAAQYRDAAMRDIAESIGPYGNGRNPRGLVEGAARALDIQRSKFRQTGSISSSNSSKPASGGAVGFLGGAMAAYIPRRAPRSSGGGMSRSFGYMSARPSPSVFGAKAA